MFPSGACVESCSQIHSDKVYDILSNEFVDHPNRQYSVKDKFCVNECPGTLSEHTLH